MSNLDSAARKKHRLLTAEAPPVATNLLDQVPTPEEIRANGIHAHVDALITVQEQNSSNAQDWNLEGKALKALRGKVGQTVKAKALIKAKQSEMKKMLLRR